MNFWLEVMVFSRVPGLALLLRAFKGASRWLHHQELEDVAHEPQPKGSKYQYDSYLVNMCAP